MNWQGKKIEDLSTNELVDASFSIAVMKSYYNDRLDNKQKRHEKIEFKVNPVFEQLSNEILEEIRKRKL